MIQGKTVLVVDDDESIIEAITIILEMSDYHVITANDRESFRRCVTQNPDIILLDIWMSGVDGRELCKEIKNSPSTLHIPVIMLSASREIEKSAKDAGADGFIAKPFDMNDFLGTINKYTQ